MTSPKLVRALWALVVCVAAVPALIAAETPDATPWRGTSAEKAWGIMQVWGTVKQNFAFFERLPGLDWDAAVRGAIPRVLDAPDQEEYYRRLNELTALLHDGHTLVVSPSLREGDYDNPPLEFQVIEDRIMGRPVRALAARSRCRRSSRSCGS